MQAEQQSDGGGEPGSAEQQIKEYGNEDCICEVQCEARAVELCEVFC